MGDRLESALAELVDARAIEQTLIAYFDRIDARDPVGASELFAADVEVEIMTGKRYRGRERFARAVGRVLDQYERTSHHLTNVRVSLAGDSAEALAYVYAYHRMAGTGEPWHLWARIRDRFERRGERWVVVEHVLIGVDSVPHRPDIPLDWYAGHPGRS